MQKHRHFLIHKPFGYLTQFVYNETKRKKNRKLLGMLGDFPDGTMAIGRLDKNSEGLLLLTTDGKMSHKVRSKSVEKEYYIEVDGEITDDAIQQLQNGVTITVDKAPYPTLPCKAFRIATPPIYDPPEKLRNRRKHRPTSWVSITISEGKNRQVRKMSAAVGFPTLRLIRMRIGGIHLNNLLAGEVVEVEDFAL